MILEKQEVISKFAVKEGDTGSSEVQVALLTKRINTLSEHMKTHKKDFHSRRGLLMMVGKRRSLLNYIKGKEQSRYSKLINALNLRR